MKYLMVYETSDVSPDLLRANYPAHRARIDEFAARGDIVASGPIVDADGRPSGLAYGVFHTRQAAEEFARGDPFVTSGAVAKWRVDSWNEILLPPPA